MDDPHTSETPLLSPTERNRAILATLDRAKLKAALFVCGMRVDSPDGMELLQSWDRAGHTLGNHTYRHTFFHDDEVTVAAYIDDILNGQEVLESFPRFERLFRFPALKEGDTLEKRDRIRSFLAERGYRVGHVTIDLSDWYIERRLQQRLETNPGADTAPFRDFYLDHLWERARFYDDLAVKVVGRPIQHTLLIHHNLLNALFLEDVLRMFEDRGWSWIDADAAFEDEIFAETPDILPAGESIVWALAKQAGTFDAVLRYPGEDGVYEEAAMDRLGL